MQFQKSGCYWSNATDQPYISDVYREYLMDGTRYQNQPWKTQYPLIYQLFYSDENLDYVKSEIMKAGFNTPPTNNDLRGFMDQIYTHDMPYGAYNRLDPHRNNKSLEYVKYYVQRLNAQLIQRVTRNMAAMRHSRVQYLRDISGPRGVIELPRGVYAQCRKSDQTILGSAFLLPNEFNEDQ
jgi:hypothetical protein